MNLKRSLTFQSKTQSIPAWGAELGIPESTIRSRLDKLGQTVEQALGTPVAVKHRPDAKPRDTAPAKAPPKMDRHVSGRARVRWSEGGTTRQLFLGRFGSTDAASAYARFCAEWWANQGHAAPDAGIQTCVAELALRYLEWAKDYYHKNGKQTSEIYRVRSVMKAVNDLYGDTATDDFGPDSFTTVRAGWVLAGLALTTVNCYAWRLSHCFSWGVSQKLVPVAVADTLHHVRALAPGRSAAPVAEHVQAAPEAGILAILPHMHTDPARCAVLVAMVKLQRLTGMRPGEVCELAAEDINRQREPWVYRPASGGKTLHLEKDRRIYFGPLARAELTPLLASAEAGRPLFRLRKYRGEGFVSVTSNFYRLALGAACRRAGVPVFRPNQIRHTYATELHRKYEDDATVAAMLGNTPQVASAVYIDDPKAAVAKRIAEAVG